MSIAERLTAGAGLLGAVPPATRVLSMVTLASWLLSVGSGSYMLGTWVARGGLVWYRVRRQGLPPGLIFTKAGLAVTGLAAWLGYLASGWPALAWTAACVLMPVVGLGLSTVTLWVPYPTGSKAATGMLTAPAEDVLAGRVTDAVLARALTDRKLAGQLVEEVVASMPDHPPRPARRSWGNLAILLPVGHGVAALTTILLTVVTTVIAAAHGAA